MAQITEISRLNRHYILCGAGRTGRNIVARFCELNIPLVVIDNNPEAVAKSRKLAERHGNVVYTVVGDATEDDTLEQAGIKQAQGLVAALSEDRDNLFTTLTARSLNPTLRIISRVNDEKNNREKLEKAGATKVVSPDTIGGMRIASEMVRPEVVRFLDQMSQVTQKEKTLRFTQLPLSQITTPELVHLIEMSRRPAATTRLRIQDIGKYTGLLVVAVKSASEQQVDENGSEVLYEIKKRYRFAPRGDLELHPDDILMVIGTQDKLDEVTQKQSDALDTAEKNT